MGNRKYHFEFVKQYYKEYNCELLETEYKNIDIPMKFKCHCGNISPKTFYYFKKVHRCGQCGNKEVGNKKRHSFDYVYNYYKERGYELLETAYKNSHSVLTYKCLKCNYVSRKKFYTFQQGYHCINCSNEKLRKERQHSYEFVLNYFQQYNCELLDKEYVNGNIPLKYKCECGNISKIAFSSFKSGTRCMKCSHKRHTKNSKRFRDYKLPSGKIIRIQGYEDVALTELLSIYNEENLLTSRKDMPRIKYMYKNKLRPYYPDIWIPSKNLLIEVKSTYTYRIDLIRNILKALAVRKLGINYEIWICNTKGLMYKL